MAKVFELQHKSFQRIFRVDFLEDWLVGSLCCPRHFQESFKGLGRVFSITTVWKHQFFSVQPSLWSNCHICTWRLTNWTFYALLKEIVIHHRKQYSDSSKLNIWSSHSTSRSIPKRLESRSSNKYLHTNVHRNCQLKEKKHSAGVVGFSFIQGPYWGL